METQDPVITGPTSFTDASATLAPAGFLKRFAAWGIDHMILAPLCILLAVAYGEMFMIVPDHSYMVKLAIVLFLGLDIVYNLIATWLFGASVGKEILGLQVVGPDGGQVGLGRALKREVLGKLLCQATLLIGFAMILRDPDGRGLHDRLAKTLVVTSPD